MKRISYILLIAVLAISSAVSCSKGSAEPEVPVQESQLSPAEAVKVLTKALTKEDLKGLSLFLKGGSVDESLYLEIKRDGTSYVAGEVGLTSGPDYKLVSLNVQVLNAISVNGTVDAWKVATYLTLARLASTPVIRQAFLDKANSAIDVLVLSDFYVRIYPIEDEQTKAISFEIVLIDKTNPDAGYVLLKELLALFL